VPLGGAAKFGYWLGGVHVCVDGLCACHARDAPIDESVYGGLIIEEVIIGDDFELARSTWNRMDNAWFILIGKRSNEIR